MAEDQSTMGGGDSPHPDVTALSESAATSGTSNSATTARDPPKSFSEQYEGRNLVKTSEEEDYSSACEGFTTDLDFEIQASSRGPNWSELAGFSSATKPEAKQLCDEAQARNASSSNSEYYSSRVDGLMERRSEFASDLEFEIEASKDHWSEMAVSSSVTRQGNCPNEGAMASNREIFRTLQKECPGEFFYEVDGDDGDVDVSVGEKIAEGGQAEIYEASALTSYGVVVKVFKEGWSLQDLQKQWPLGMLKQIKPEGNFAISPFVCPVYCGIFWKTGRFAGRFGFEMPRCWGDLRKLIDIRMQRNHNIKCPPFTDNEAVYHMRDIAKAMTALHKHNICHRDLKASNVLIDDSFGRRPFDPMAVRKNGSLCVRVADFECSVGVIGTRFWRAPEILLGIKNRDMQPHLFTKESDVYSYAMTCYEILTGRIPFEELRATEYDAVLRGERPELPKQIEPWIRELMRRCWHTDLSERPTFGDILGVFKTHEKRV